MSECSNGFSQQMSELNCMNGKGILDSYQAIIQQGVMDNQRDARSHATLQNATLAWAETMKVFSATGLLIAGQTGMTENQQHISPAEQAAASAIQAAPGVAADSIATSNAVVATANAAVAASIGNLATALVPIMQASAGNTTTITAEALASLLSVVITAAGGASTPSQTQPKPTA